MVDCFDIFNYELNGKNYIAYSVDNIIRFGKKSEFGVDNNLTDVESFIIRSIYNFIVGDKKKLLNLSPIHFNGKEVGVFYNTDNRLYSFYQLNNNELCDLDEFTVTKLNYIFNNQKNFYKKDENLTNSNNKYKIFLKVSGVVTAVILSGSLVLSSLPIVPNNLELFKADYLIDSLYKNRLAKEQNSNYSYDEIITIINSNRDLNDKEKLFLINGLEKEINENIEFIDISQLKRNLSELKIIYHNKYEYNPFVGNVKGRYISYGSYRNRIDLYGDEKYITNSYNDCDESTLVHEINHLLNKRSFLLTLSGSFGNTAEVVRLAMGLDKGGAMEEMFNELFSREYYNDFSRKERTNGYSRIMPVMYALCEILDETTIKKYKFDSDYFYIVNYFDSIGVDKTYIYNLYNYLELINQNCAEKDIYLKTYNIIKYCYETKYGMEMENDLIMMSYLYNTAYVNDEFNKKYKEILGDNDITLKISPKGYVSKTYKKEHPNVEIIINENDKIIISEENRYIASTLIK